MVHGFVQQSHGRLDIESEPGRGTQVRMVFRVAEQAATDDASLVEHRGGTVEEPQQRRYRILVVEYNDDVRELAESMLDMAGYMDELPGRGKRSEGLDVLTKPTSTRTCWTAWGPRSSAA